MESILSIVTYQIPSYIVVILIAMGFIMGVSFNIIQGFKKTDEIYITHAKRFAEVGHNITERMVRELDNRMVDKSATQVRQLKERVEILEKQKADLTAQYLELSNAPDKIEEGNYGEEEDDGSGDGKSSYTAPSVDEGKRGSRVSNFK